MIVRRARPCIDLSSTRSGVPVTGINTFLTQFSKLQLIPVFKYSTFVTYQLVDLGSIAARFHKTTPHSQSNRPREVLVIIRVTYRQQYI